MPRGPVGRLVVLLLAIAACEGPFEPPSGTIRVLATTTGSDIDPDGYAVRLDGTPAQTLAPNDTVMFPGQVVGRHDVALSGAAVNCAIAGGTARQVDVTTGATVDVVFSASCAPLVGALRVTTTTSGADLDPDGYLISVDGGPGVAIPGAGARVIPNVPVGPHTVALNDLSGNCTAGPSNPQSVTVGYGTLSTTAFTITCVAVTGSVQVNTTTTGFDFDPDGYVVDLDGAGGPAVPVNGGVTVPGLSPGPHAITLTGSAPNCAVAAPNPVTVSVAVGVTDTADFTITCAATTGSLQIATATTGGSLDPDGYTVLVDYTCDYYYGCYAAWSEPVGVNDTLTVSRVPEGDHVVTLDGVAPNCTVAGANPVTTSVPVLDTARLTFAVTCLPAGTVEVTVVTSGIDLPTGYGLELDGVSSGFVAANGTATLRHVLEGDHTVGLVGVASNCSVTGSNPVAVHVAVDDTVRTTFQVTCISAFGTLAIAVTTSGSNLDPDGYTVAVDSVCDYYYGCYAVWTEPAAVNDTVVVPNVPIGPHTIWLDGVAPGCGVAGPNPVMATVPSADTARVAFVVACTAAAGTRQATQGGRRTSRANPIDRSRSPPAPRGELRRGSW